MIHLENGMGLANDHFRLAMIPIERVWLPYDLAADLVDVIELNCKWLGRVHITFLILIAAYHEILIRILRHHVGSCENP